MLIALTFGQAECGNTLLLTAKNWMLAYGNTCLITSTGTQASPGEGFELPEIGVKPESNDCAWGESIDFEGS